MANRTFLVAPRILVIFHEDAHKITQRSAANIGTCTQMRRVSLTRQRKRNSTCWRKNKNATQLVFGVLRNQHAEQARIARLDKVLDELDRPARKHADAGRRQTAVGDARRERRVRPSDARHVRERGREHGATHARVGVGCGRGRAGRCGGGWAGGCG